MALRRSVVAVAVARSLFIVVIRVALVAAAAAVVMTTVVAMTADVVVAGTRVAPFAVRGGYYLGGVAAHSGHPTCLLVQVPLEDGVPAGL